MRLIFKPWKDALPEHIADRLTQVRDEFANLVEEAVSSRRLNLFNRFDADITDLLRVDPQNELARDYWHEMNHEQPRPPFTLPQAPAGRSAVGLSAGRRPRLPQAPHQLVHRQSPDLERRIRRRPL